MRLSKEWTAAVLEPISPRMKNHLSSEKSPYLLQHKDNPIHWYAWGNEAFQVAREKQKPIFLSVGYSTCHWCHVMAHECFEDQEVADQLNQDFIAIKVDREERPDVDHLYMKALLAMTGGGGWPMSVWLTPEGKPFFAGTYFPKYRFQQLLRRVSDIWRDQRESLQKDCEQMMKAIADLDKRSPQASSDEGQRQEFLSSYINHFQYAFDEKYGGFGQAPKFPQTMNLMLMMRRDLKTGLRQAEVMVTTTLSNMIRQGLFDHLRGGFHRYSVDAKWLVPHFEKMLYDQALAVVTLLEAHQLYNQPEFEAAARETLDYVLKEMTSNEGGFYAAQDADSLDPNSNKKHEGYFATYSFAELESHLSAEELAQLKETYGVCAEGQFEGRNILHLQSGFDFESKRDPTILSAFKKLEKLRSARPEPHLDDKIITAWNGWMIWALSYAGRSLKEPKYRDAAEKAWTWILKTNLKDGHLKRFYREGQAVAEGTAEDYAALILAGLELGLSDPMQTKIILDLQSVLDQNFWDKEFGGYFSDAGRDANLPMRTKDEYDGVTPSANSMAAFNLVRLYQLTGESVYQDKAEKLFQLYFAQLKQFPSGLPFLGVALDFCLSKPKVVVSSEASWPKEWSTERRSEFHPSTLFVGSGSGWPVTLGKSSTGVYICESGTCFKPAQNLIEASEQLNR